MKRTWSYRLLLVLSLLLTSSCGAVIPSRVLKEENPVEKKVIIDETLAQAPKVVTQQIADIRQTKMEGSTSPLNISRKESTLPGSSQTVEKQDPSSSDGMGPPTIPKTPPMTNQELLDSALEFAQISNDFWEQGDMDNALDALDKAYSLILRVNHGDDPEVLQQKEDLRFTISKRIIAVYSSMFTVANGNYKAIPLVMNRHIRRAIDLFKGREKKFFLDSYRRSGRYRSAIVKALKEAGLPEELSWLPLIESGFKVRAFSKARALGLWQFIASTGYKFGLKRNRWIDERMDPEKSTKAAVAYLKELHQIFGDWTTALAAYNCGEWAVLRRIKTQKINYLDNFWDLYAKLPRETAFYVPKFLAVLHILNDPEAHGFDLVAVDEEIEWEKVAINKHAHLRTIAKRLDIDYELLKNLNPELRHNGTPEGPYLIKTPAGKGALLLAKLNDIPVWSPSVSAYVTHKVRSGESLSLIAHRYRTSVRSIMAMNGLRKKHYLKAGWKLKIPTKKRRALPTKRPPTYSLKRAGKYYKYVVRKGDSLWKIAEQFKTTTKAIRSVNQVGSSPLRIGQVLMIPSVTTTSKPFEGKKYRVKEGDSPYLIARKYEMNLAEFLKLNNLTPRTTIFPGQIVTVKIE